MSIRCAAGAENPLAVQFQAPGGKLISGTGKSWFNVFERAASLALVVAALAGPPCLARVLPPCFPPVEIADAKIVRVERNGVLVLADGRAAKLEGILLPAGAADRAPDFPAAQAIARLSDLAVAHAVTLAAAAPKEDRYGRLRAQVVATGQIGGVWLQNELLRQGLARVDIAPDRSECAAEFYATEQRARAERVGLWSLPSYGLRTPSQAQRDAGTFQIVTGTIVRVSQRGGRIALEFSRDSRNGLAVTISPQDLKTFRAIGVDPYSYENQTVRVRGWIERFRRPEMAVATPSDIEIVDMPALRGSIAASR